MTGNNHNAILQETRGVKMKLSPAEVLIQTFGGLRATAKALNRDESNVWRWKTSGIPAGIMRKVLEISRKKDLGLTLDDLWYGRNVK